MGTNVLTARGRLATRVLRAQKAPALWKIRNLGHIVSGLALGRLARVLGMSHISARLYVELHMANGQWIDYGLVSTRLVTSAFVNFLVDQLQSDTTEIGDFKYHDSGTGIGDESTGDTGLGTECTVQVGDERFAGSQTESASNIYKSVGTINYDGSAAITEHGLFSKTRAGGGTLMDRSKFAAINVTNGDSIQFTYELTCNAGG